MPLNEDYTPTGFSDLSAAAHNNAGDLLQSARLLLKEGCFPHAYALAFTACEEIAKSVAANDVFTGALSEGEFSKLVRNHEIKVQRTEWMHQKATGIFLVNPFAEDINDVETWTPDAPSFERRNSSLYAEFKRGTHIVETPRSAITEEQARDLVHTGEVALDTAIVMEVNGTPFTSKGLRKFLVG